MGNNNSSSINNNLENSILQASSTTCSIAAVNDFNNNFLVADNISISQLATQDAACSISNTFDATVLNTIKNTSQQTASAESGFIFPSIQFNNNSSSMDTNVSNNIAQIMTNNCTITANNSEDNNVMYASGDIVISQTIPPGTKGNCAIQNMASVSVSNDLSNYNTQTASITNAITQIVLILAVCGTITAVGMAAFKKKGEGNDMSNTSLSNMILNNPYNKGGGV